MNRENLTIPALVASSLLAMIGALGFCAGILFGVFPLALASLFAMLIGLAVTLTI